MIRCGEYHIVVTLDGAGGTSVSSTERNAMVSLDATLTSSTDQNPAVAGHLNVAFNPNAMFKPEDSGKINGIKPVSAYGQSVLAAEPTIAPVAVPKNVEDSDIVAARRMEKLAKAVRERDAQPAAASATGNEARQGLEAFCRGAGIDAINLNSDNAAGMLQLAGRLLREALISLKDLDTKQTETRSRFRLPGEKNDDTLPFRVGAATDELIAALLSSHDSRRLDPGQWLRQCFERQARHEEAVARGAQNGFAEFLRQLDPKDLERRFASAQKRGVLSKGPNFWQLYADFYRTACEPQAGETVPALYAESFAQAYAASLKKS
jgi:type VI secretion system protein